MAKNQNYQNDLEISLGMGVSSKEVEASIEELFEKLKTSSTGLKEKEAKARLEIYGLNEPARKKKRTLLIQILSKFINPLVIVLIIIGLFSLFFGEKISAVLVFAMVVISVFLSFFQEHRSGKEAEKLSEMVRATATVIRNGSPKEIKIRDIVPGDIIDLSAGDMVPADLRVFSCKDLFANQASLTGESFPIEKVAEPVYPKGTSLSELRNIAFMGSSIVSGTGFGLVLKTGIHTQFGELSRKLAMMRTETSFDKGIREFVWMMIRNMLVLVVVIFGINFFLKGDWVQALLFSLAVAVGLTPEMLPMLVSINLSKGAIAMSRKQVIVKRLNAIQNFGAMDILCTDKTGTLTLDKIVLERYCDVVRQENEDTLKFAYLNSFYQTGLKNILDKAILDHEKILSQPYKKVDEVPFDFSRRIMSVVIDREGKHQLIAKGAPEEIFKRCTHFELDGEILEMENILLADLKEEYDHLSSEGFRVLAVAYRDMTEPKLVYSKDDEQNLILKGYLAFLDPPKPSAKRAVEALRKHGVTVKVLTGDNELVTKKICGDVGLNVSALVTGDEVEKMDDSQLRERVESVTVFARLSPLQKERVIQVLRTNGHVVGYLGDGINDAPSLKTSDVGISVNNAADIAKESADMILLKKSLMVLEDGVREGRRTFGNILKYIKMGSSSNFGNMFSMTGASAFLKFLPMTPIQILLNNFLYDLSQLAIATDSVDEEYLLKPRTWNVKAIRRVMRVMGPLSSLFDFLTFGVLLFVFHASEKLFHTGWFLESLCTQTLVIYILRSEKIPFIQSRPSRLLVMTSLAVIAVGLFLPFSGLADPFGFVRPPMFFFLALFLIVLAYLLTLHFTYRWFVRRYGHD